MTTIINKLKNRKGFTLVELIVVIAVLGIIMSIAVPRYIGIQEQARVDADYTTGAMIAKAAELYYVQHEGATGLGTGNENLTNIQNVNFQSAKIKDKKLADVDIGYNSTTGQITVKIVDGTDTYPLYPTPTGTSKNLK